MEYFQVRLNPYRLSGGIVLPPEEVAAGGVVPVVGGVVPPLGDVPAGHGAVPAAVPVVVPGWPVALPGFAAVPVPVPVPVALPLAVVDGTQFGAAVPLAP
ncbi:MAG: hypothetical protein JO041_03450, partial [Acidobacteria bacterium]|nr:hypothetical protein [Acidobacteriota bacterium]